MTTTLIIGATGRLASQVAAKLSSNPAMSLRLTSSRDEGVEALRAAYPHAEVMKADWYDLASLKTAFNGVNRVLVIPQDFTDETVVTPNVIAAARSTPSVEQIVRLIAMKPGLKPETMSEEWKETRTGSGMHPIGKALLDESGLPLTYINTCAWFASNLSWMIAEDVKRHRQVRLPHDAKRAWLGEDDMAEAFATVLAEGPAKHIGREYILTSRESYSFDDIAALISSAIGETVTYNDTEAGLREALGDMGDTIVTYMKHEKLGWSEKLEVNDIERLIGRHEVTLPEIIRASRELFI